MVAADNSVLRSYYFKAPEQCGRYTIKLGEHSQSDIIRIDENGDKSEPNCILYGLDILVGDDVPVPAAATPATKIQGGAKDFEGYYYAVLYSAGWGNPYYTEMAQFNYSNLSEIGDKTAIYLKNTTAHAGDKNVPVHVCIKNNPGIGVAHLNIIPDARLSFEKSYGRHHDITVDSAFTGCDWLYGMESNSSDYGFHCVDDEGLSLRNEIYGVEDEYLASCPYWEFGFNALPDDYNFTADGTMLTFYVDIPEDATAGEEFKLETRIAGLRWGGTRIMNYPIYPLCTVDGVIRIVE